MFEEDVESRGREREAVDGASRSGLPSPKGNRDHWPLLPAREKGGLLRRGRTGGGENVQKDGEGNADQGEGPEQAKQGRRE
jgi:hypothetical protein